MAVSSSARSVLTSDDFCAIHKLCNCFTQTFEYLGDVFVSAFSTRRSSLAVGTALMHIFKEHDAKTKVPQRLILLYLLYRVEDLDIALDRHKQTVEDQIDDILWHPFLVFFVSLLDCEKETRSMDLANDLFEAHSKANLYERYLLGCLLNGEHNSVASRNVNDLIQIVYHKVDEESEDFCMKMVELDRYKAALKQRQANYSALVNASIPALIKLPDATREYNDEMAFKKSLLSIACNPFMTDLLPPAFHRVTPTLMPPSDDEFQFLYPFLLEPLWMDAETLKPDANVPSLADANADRNAEQNVDQAIIISDGKKLKSSASSQSLKSSDKSKVSDDESSASKTNDHSSQTLQPCHQTAPKAIKNLSDPRKKWGNSLPSSPKTLIGTEDTDEASNTVSPAYHRSSRTVSLSSLPYQRSSSVDTAKTCATDENILTVESSNTSMVSSVCSEKEKDKRPPLTHAEAVELVKKSLVSVLGRIEAQRLSEAIAADGSVADLVNIPITQYPKFIDENPAVAAAVIVRRVNKNAGELEAFFDLLLSMNLSVQGMEVVNKLCSQSKFPQEYLNSYIMMCVSRCQDQKQSSLQCRQVRMVCVFLSSLIRNSNWDVHPLAVELQSFVLKFNHVREAVSLYQAILVALQPPPESATNSSSSSNFMTATTITNTVAQSSTSGSAQDSNISATCESPVS
ncbi:unnamed protein product [Anisakis simplex]|uniref:CCR4-NOT transcription complex subunit 11 n=1 Tax=Anisakis simplex TaxID=6269 RepID=A0A158PPR4_ANISI|nr:unnamed protein product [Anisakis simplex]